MEDERLVNRPLKQSRASLEAQLSRIRLPNAGDTGSSPGLGRSHMPRSN